MPTIYFFLIIKENPAPGGWPQLAPCFCFRLQINKRKSYKKGKSLVIHDKSVNQNMIETEHVVKGRTLIYHKESWFPINLKSTINLKKSCKNSQSENCTIDWYILNLQALMKSRWKKQYSQLESYYDLDCRKVFFSATVIV